MVTDNRGTLGDAAPVEYSAWIHRLDRLLQPERTTVYPLLILILWPLAWMFTMLIGSQPMMVDFVARWTGGRMLTAGGGDHLYDPLAQIAYQVDLFGQEGALSWFVGPPFEAVLLTPLGLLPYPAGVLLWTIASMAALVISLRLLGGEARPPALHWRRFVVIAFASAPVMELVFSGQNTTYVLLWLVLAHRAIQKGHPFTAGLLFALALVKPHLVLLVPVLWLLERRWTALAGLATGAVIWLVISVAAGPNSVMRWLEALQSGLFVGEVHEGQTLKTGGLVGLITPWLPTGGTAPWESGASVGSLLLGLGAVVFVWRRTSDAAIRWWFVVIVAVATAPHAMVYDLVLAIPAVGLAMLRWWSAPVRVSVAITWVAFWILPPLSIGAAQIEPLTRIAMTPWHVISLLVLIGVLLSRLGTPPVCESPIQVASEQTQGAQAKNDLRA